MEAAIFTSEFSSNQSLIDSKSAFATYFLPFKIRKKTVGLCLGVIFAVFVTVIHPSERDISVVTVTVCNCFLEPTMDLPQPKQGAPC